MEKTKVVCIEKRQSDNAWHVLLKPLFLQLHPFSFFFYHLTTNQSRILYTMVTIIDAYEKKKKQIKQKKYKIGVHMVTVDPTYNTSVSIVIKISLALKNAKRLIDL